jgi:hypothetical protein
MISRPNGPRTRTRTLALTAALGFASLGALSAQQDGARPDAATAPPSLKETRLVMGKWIETQQIISKERNDWQQGKEILTNRLDLMRREITGIEEKIKQAEQSVAETAAKKSELLAQEEALQSATGQLASAVTKLEADVRRLFKSLPEPLTTKLQPLYQRIPEDAGNTRVTVAERFQNVLGILTELNKANTEITVDYEVRNLEGGKPSEVRVMYVGLTQAYYVSARGEAGIGRPTADGWKWEPSKAVADDVAMALEMIQGKQSPAFVPLPVKLQ